MALSYGILDEEYWSINRKVSIEVFLRAHGWINQTKSCRSIMIEIPLSEMRQMRTYKLLAMPD